MDKSSKEYSKDISKDISKEIVKILNKNTYNQLVTKELNIFFYL